jgi:hypothetical protein
MKLYRNKQYKILFNKHTKKYSYAYNIGWFFWYDSGKPGKFKTTHLYDSEAAAKEAVKEVIDRQLDSHFMEVDE